MAIRVPQIGRRQVNLQSLPLIRPTLGLPVYTTRKVTPGLNTSNLQEIETRLLGSILMLRRALSYIQNTGGKISTRFFDEDHEPIGPDLRARLREHDLIKVDHNGNITISARGEQVLRDMKDE